MAPKVSIGFPVYNGERYMRDALDALLTQTFRDFEIVLSDNVSTDATQSICEDYARRDARIRYIRQPRPLHVIDHFNFVLHESRGDYFMWQASDDRRHPAWLERASAILDSEPDASLVFCNFVRHSFLTGETTREPSVVPSYGSTFRRVLLRMTNPVSNAVYGLFRRASAADLPNADLGDILYLLRLAVAGEIHILPERMFTAGVKKENLAARPLNGDAMQIDTYAREVSSLIRANFRGVQRLVLLAIHARQVRTWRRLFRTK